MSQETGIVETTEDEWVWVKTRRKSACAHCGHKDHCQMIDGGDQMRVKARNLAAAREGDEVELYLDTKTQLKCVFMVYMVPVIGLLVGAFSGNSLSPLIGLSPNMGIFLFSVVGLIAGFIITRLFANRVETKNAMTPLVKRVVRRSAG
ncbi:MAG: SoxR reducing system RseC family protein [Desulfobacterales bacterium]